jgi:3-dehydroquinate synthase
MTTTIHVAGPSPYDVTLGHGLADRLPDLLTGAATVAVVADERIRHLADEPIRALQQAGCRVEPLTIPAGEAAKSLDVTARLWDDLGRLRLTRSDAVVAVGGGATTDVAGFAAATWLRGVRVVHVPTTLLAMVDAAIGGKTGVNTGAGKNLVGAFHPPAGVLVDLDLLATLPDAEWVNGMAEVVKAGFIADPVILELIESDPVAASSPRGPHTQELIERAVAMKAAVVSQDLREAGPREVLNYGHTLAHAIERVEDFAVPHGHAVAVGMVYVAELARAAGRLPDEVAARHRELLQAIGLPTTHPRAAWPRLRKTMQVDKKARGAVLRFVVLDGLARPGVLEDPDEALLEAAYAKVAV